MAVDHGYNRSLPPVLDAHVTTLLTAIILYIFGTGPIKGFATTQIIAVVLNLFCGILIARLVSEWWTNKKGRHFEYFTKLSRVIFKKAHFKFVEARKYAYAVSVVVFIFGIGSFFYGFDEGVEYKGGRSYTVHFEHPQKSDEIKNALQKVFGEYPVIKTVGDTRTLNITTSLRKKTPPVRRTLWLKPLCSWDLNPSWQKVQLHPTLRKYTFRARRVFSLLFRKT